MHNCCCNSVSYKFLLFFFSLWCWHIIYICYIADCSKEVWEIILYINKNYFRKAKVDIMENYIFYRYKEWLKARDGNLLKQVSKLTIGAIILLSLLFVVLITMFVFILLYWVLIAAQGISELCCGMQALKALFYVPFGTFFKILCHNASFIRV